MPPSLLFLLIILAGLFAVFLFMVFSGTRPDYEKFIKPGYSFVEELKQEGKYESLYPEKEWWLPKKERTGDEKAEVGERTVRSSRRKRKSSEIKQKQRKNSEIKQKEEKEQ